MTRLPFWANITTRLDKHRVTGAEREQILGKHACWFKKPLHQVRPALVAVSSKETDA
jgi:hypothetical protein